MQDDLNERFIDGWEFAPLDFWPTPSKPDPDKRLAIFDHFGPCATPGCLCEEPEPVNFEGRCYPCQDETAEGIPSRY